MPRGLWKRIRCQHPTRLASEKALSAISFRGTSRTAIRKKLDHQRGLLRLVMGDSSAVGRQDWRASSLLRLRRPQSSGNGRSDPPGGVGGEGEALGGIE